MKRKIRIDKVKPLKDSYKAPDGYFESLYDKIQAKKNEPGGINIDDLKPEDESFKAPDGYFESLYDKIQAKKNESGKIKLEDINSTQESFKTPDGYFESLADKISERKDTETRTIKMGRKPLMVWSAVAGIAAVLMIGIFMVQLMNNTPQPNHSAEQIPDIDVADSELACLLDDCVADEFMLTEEEIIEVIEYENNQDEADAIIDYLDEESLDFEDDFLDAI